ncbi:MAG: hypothetical protein ACN6Q8_07080, partial [Stenotrophomonas sp.]
REVVPSHARQGLAERKATCSRAPKRTSPGVPTHARQKPFKQRIRTAGAASTAQQASAKPQASQNSDA